MELTQTTLTLLSITSVLLIISVLSIRSTLYPHYLAMRWGKKSVKWPFVHGTIRYSGVRRVKYGGNSIVYYRPDVEYEYFVNGKSLIGRRVEFGIQTNTDEKLARKISRRYPRDSQRRVYYNPQNPKVCVLDPGMSSQDLRNGHYFSAFVGFVVLFGLLIAVGMLVSLLI